MITIPEAPTPAEEWKHGAEPWQAIAYELWCLRRWPSAHRPRLLRKILENILEHCADSDGGDACSVVRELAEALLPVVGEPSSG